MISLQNVAKTFLSKDGAPVPAVKGVSLTVKKREFVILTGRSGSGKTTLLNLPAGLTRPTAGEVRLGDVNLWTLSDREQSQLRNRKIGFIFQFPSLLPSLSVIENLLLPLNFRRNGTAGAAERARQLLATVGIADKMGAYPRQLSAGQQQRVVIARAMILGPRLVVADEPVSMLDASVRVEILKLLRGPGEVLQGAFKFFRVNCCGHVFSFSKVQALIRLRFLSRDPGVPNKGMRMKKKNPFPRRLGVYPKSCICKEVS